MSYLMDDDTFHKLEHVCFQVLKFLRTIPELQTEKIAVIGGMAVCKHLLPLPCPPTQDVDFCLTSTGAPEKVKVKLLALPKSPFNKYADIFGYGADRNFVQVDFVNTIMLPYIPTAAVTVKELTTGEIPYTSVTDLLVYKIHCCGLRAKDKRYKDADGAYELLKSLPTDLPLNSRQRLCISECLVDVVSNGYHGKNEAWWKARLGL